MSRPVFSLGRQPVDGGDDAPTIAAKLNQYTADITRSGLPRVALLGHSIPRYHIFIPTGANAGKSGRGYMHHVAAMLQGRISVPAALNFGVASEISSKIMARVPDVIASGASMCVVHAAHNDFTNLMPSGQPGQVGTPGGATSANWGTTIGNVDYMINALIDGGVKVILLEEFAAQFWNGLADPQLTQAYQLNAVYNRWVRSRDKVYPPNQLVVCPTGKSYRDYSNGLSLTDSTISDLLHPNYRGAWLTALDIKPAIQAMLPPMSAYSLDALDTYDATLNPVGPVNTDALFLGATGSATATGATGTKPTSLTIARPSGGGSTITAAVSLDARTTANGGNRLKLVFSTAGTGGTKEVIQIKLATAVPRSGGKYGAGDSITMSTVVEMASGVTKFEGFTIYAVENDGTSSFIYYAIVNAGTVIDNNVPDTGGPVYYSTEAFTVRPDNPSGGTLDARIEFWFDCSAVGAQTLGTAYVDLLALRKSSAPALTA